MTQICPPPCDHAVIRSAADCPPCKARTGRWVLAATIVGSSMAFVDGTVVNVALPVLQAELDVSVAGLQWIIESYMLFLAALILVGGMLGDRHGRRRMFAAGIVVFAAASVWCGLAPDAAMLIVARAAQGIGGALLVPGSLSLISATFGEAQRGRAFGLWSGFTALAMALGPPLGGWLVDNVSWRWIFFINIPPAVVVLWILHRHVPESRDEGAAGALDWPGAALVTVGLGALVFGLVEAGTAGFGAPGVLVPIVVGAAAMAAFLAIQSRSATPMMPLELFRSRSFSGANLITLLLYAGLSGGLFFFPFMLIQVHGYSATAAGAAFLPFVVIMFLLSRWAGTMTSRFGGRPLLVAGPAIAAAGFALFAVPGAGGSYWTTYFPAVVVLGLGMAVSVAPLTTVVMAAVEVRRAGIASGINNAVARVAGLVAIAAMGVVVSAVFDDALGASLATLDLPTEAVELLAAQRSSLAGTEVPLALGADQRAAVQGAIDAAFLAGFRLVMAIAAVLALASAAVAAITIERKAG